MSNWSDYEIIHSALMAGEARSIKRERFLYSEAHMALARLQRIAAPSPAPKTGRCAERAKPGGCQLHNLHCGYPKCDEWPAAPRAHGEKEGGPA